MSRWTFLGSQNKVERYAFLICVNKLYLFDPRIGKDIDKEKPKELSKEQIAKMNNDSKIQMLNLSRMGKLTEILLDSKYVRTNRTIETKEKTK